MRRLIYICFIFIAIFSIILSCSFNNLLYADEIIRVDSNTSGQMQPGLDDDYIVWEDIRDGISQIYVFDLESNNSFPIDPTNSVQSWASIHKNKVVWEDKRSGLSQIYFYDLSDPNTAPVNIDPTGTDQQYPAIFGNTIVWTDLRDGGYRIYMYSLDTETVTRLDPTNAVQVFPDIYKNNVVWMDYRDEINQIYLYDIATRISTRISPSSHDQRNPSIFKDKIVWLDQGRTPSQIKLYDISTGTTSILNPSTTSSRMYPDISGNNVIWLDDESGNDQVYLYNLKTGADPIRIFPTSAIQDYPAIYGDKIVWSDWSDLGSDPQTYLYTIPPEWENPVVLPNFFERIKNFFLSIVEIFSQIIDRVRSSSNTPDTEKIKEDEVEDKDVKEEKTEDIIEEELIDEKESETMEEEKAATEKDKEDSELSKSPPTVELRIKEGPIYSEEDKICFYRIEALVSGEPPPRVEFSRDDSDGAWGPSIAQINLYSGTSIDIIELKWGCEIEEEFDFSNLDIIGIEKIIEGVDIGQATLPHIVLHPSDIGHIVNPSGVDTKTCIIGDSVTNTNIKGYFAFDLRPLIGKDVTAATLYMDGTVMGDPSFKGNIGLRWGEYLPLEADDYLMLGLVRPVDTFNNDENPIIFSRADLVVAIENCANYPIKLQFGVAYYYDTTDEDKISDGMEYRIEDISLVIFYIN